MSKIKFIKEKYNENQEWRFSVKKITLLSQKEYRYICKCIDIREFNQPKDKWFRELLKEFKENFSPKVGKFLNKKSGKVIDSFDLQEEFDASFYIR